MFNIVEKRRWYFIGSGLVILLGVLAMIWSLVRFGEPVRLSVDFTGGSRFVLTFDGPVDEDAIREVYAGLGFEEAIIQRLGAQEDNAWQVRTREAAPEQIGIVYFAGIDGARFKKPVKPGDRLVLKVEIVREMRGIWKYRARAEVEGELAAEAELMATLRDK